MSGRLEIGCLVLIVIRPEDKQVEGSYFSGARGTLIKGPYHDWDGVPCWSVQGPEIQERAIRHETSGAPSDIILWAPASRLIRIDDPDVGLDDGVPTDEPSSVGA